MVKILFLAAPLLLLFSLRAEGQLTKNLEGYYKFDEITGSTKAIDATGNNNSVAVYASSGALGKLGTSYLFNGTSNYILFGSNTDWLAFGTSSFTISAWVYPTSFSTSWRGVIGGGTGCFVLGTYGTGGYLYAAKNDVAGSPSSNLALKLNQWNFVAVTFNSTATSNNLIFYVNSASSTVSFNYDFTTGATSNIIGGVKAATNPFSGYIDELGVWKRELAPSEIMQLYAGGAGLAYPFGPVNVPVTGVTLCPVSVPLLVNSTKQLIATIAPANATNQKLSWASSNTSVLTVSTTGLVTSVAEGSATITATAQDGNYSSACLINVIATNSLETGLEEYYNFNEISGQLQDVEPLNAINSISVSATQGLPGKIGNCYLFNGTSNRVTFADNANWSIKQATDLSISAWINFSADISGEWGNIFGTSSTYSFQVRKISSGNYQLIYWAGGSGLSASSTFMITPGTWYHVAVTKLGASEVKFYKNNELLGTMRPANLDCDPSANYIGGNEGTEYFNGKIDELGIWKRVLTYSEVSGLYNFGNGKAYPFTLNPPVNLTISFDDNTQPIQATSQSKVKECKVDQNVKLNASMENVGEIYSTGLTYATLSWQNIGQNTEYFIVERSRPLDLNRFDEVGRVIYLSGINDYSLHVNGYFFLYPVKYRVIAVTSQLRSTPAQTPLVTTRRKLWMFDNYDSASKTFKDQTGNFTAYVGNNTFPITTLASPHNTAVSLTGNGSNIDFGPIQSIYWGIKLSGWFKMTGGDGRRNLFTNKNADEKNGFCVYYDASKNKLCLNYGNKDNEDVKETNVNLADGLWHHIAYNLYSYQNYNTCQIYIDGAPVESQIELTYNFKINSNSLLVGARKSGTNYIDCYGGYVDNVSINFLQAIDEYNWNTPPYATGVTITGNTEVNGTLTFTYAYHDDDVPADLENFDGLRPGDNDGTHAYWLRADSVDGKNEKFIHMGLNYISTKEDEGKYLRIAFIPDAKTGYKSGKTAFSEYIPIGTFPIKFRNNKLFTHNNKPFLLIGDSPWYIMTELLDDDDDNTDNSEVDIYLSNRKEKMVNALIIDLIEKNYREPRRPANFSNILPFAQIPGTSLYDFSKPNELYFDQAIRLINNAAKRGILVLLHPAYVGYNYNISFVDGWYNDIKKNSGNMYSYGKYIGNKFRNCKNIMWVMGGDCAPYDNGSHDVRKEIRDMVRGIKEKGRGDQLFTVQNGRGESGVTTYDWPGADSWIDINTAYDDDNCSATETQLACSLDYRRNIPYIYFEGKYESLNQKDASDSNRECIRGQMYIPVLMGAQGYFFGNNPLYQFKKSGEFHWKTLLNSHGANDLGYSAKLFNYCKWDKLTPESNHNILTQGYVPVNGKIALAAKLTLTGQNKYSLIAYAQTTRRLTINLSNLAVADGSQYNYWWYNPSTGTINLPASSGTYNASTPQAHFDAPALAGDWVLVIDDASACPMPAMVIQSAENTNTNNQLVANNVISEKVADRFLYPNPAHDKLYVTTTLTGQSMVTIYDVYGNKAFQQQGQINHIDISMLSSGIYFVKLAEPNHVIINKFVKE